MRIRIRREYNFGRSYAIRGYVAQTLPLHLWLHVKRVDHVSLKEGQYYLECLDGANAEVCRAVTQLCTAVFELDEVSIINLCRVGDRMVLDIVFYHGSPPKSVLKKIDARMRAALTQFSAEVMPN